MAEGLSSLQCTPEVKIGPVRSSYEWVTLEVLTKQLTFRAPVFPARTYFTENICDFVLFGKCII